MQIPSHLVNEHYDDRYFDVVNAIQEAWQVFIDGNRIIERVKARDQLTPFHIGETGFGAGRILVALLEQCRRANLTNVNIVYHSVELHPLTSEKMDAILACFREIAGESISALLHQYSMVDLSVKGLHQFVLDQPFGTIAVDLWIGEVLEMVTGLSVCCDAWFLDGHGPKKNPAMWRPELLFAISNKTVHGGTFATYTVAGDVRRGLQKSGFDIEKVQGFGGKKSVMQGVKLRDVSATDLLNNQDK